MSFVVTIAGNDRTSSVVFKSFKKTDNINQQVDTLNFRTRKYGAITFTPEVGQEIIVTKDGDRIFGGVILRVDESVVASKILEYQVTCSDYSHYLRRRIVTERYENMTANTIIADLINTYATDFTYVNVNAPVQIESIAFNRITVAECLQKLAETLSYVWYVDYDQDLHFMPKNGESAPVELTDTSGTYIYDSLKIIDDLSQVKNSVLVQGGNATSTVMRSEFFSGNGGREQFSLANKFSSLPTVTVGGTPQTVGVEYLDDDASFDVMWNYNEKYVRFTSGNIPGAGTDNIEVEGLYEFPIVVRVPAPSSIGAYGIYEFTITDKNIRSQEEAIDRAIAELTVYQNELYEGEFRTYQDGIRSGQTLRINSTQRGRDIQVVIQSVASVMRDPLGEQMEYAVRFATLKSIGIIEYLQRQLRDREIIEDDQETLLNYIANTDTCGFSDSLSAPVITMPPYKYSNDAGTTPNKARFGYSTYS